VSLPLLPVIFLWQDQQVIEPLALGITKFSCLRSLDLAELYSLASAELLKVQDNRNLLSFSRSLVGG